MNTDKTDSETKNTEIEWIGKIPSHWEFKKLKYIEGIRVISGISPPSNSYNDTHGPYFLQGCENFTDIYPDLKIRTSQPIKVVEKNTILISVRAPVGELNIASQSICIGRGLVGIHTNGEVIDYRYLYYFLKIGKEQLFVLSRGTTYDSIRVDDIRNLRVPCPSMEEQLCIIKYLKNKIEQIYSITGKIEEQILKLQEYKQSLISHVVTGKLNLGNDK